MINLSDINDESTILYLDPNGKVGSISKQWILKKLYEGISLEGFQFILSDMPYFVDEFKLKYPDFGAIFVDVKRKDVIEEYKCLICKSVYEEGTEYCPVCSKKGYMYLGDISEVQSKGVKQPPNLGCYDFVMDHSVKRR